MSVIYPGNYVARLNAYRDQGVVAIPGVEFYRAVGAVVLNPDNDAITTAGVLAAAAEEPPASLVAFAQAVHATCSAPRPSCSSAS